jgi:hypothetical protein
MIMKNLSLFKQLFITALLILFGTFAISGQNYETSKTVNKTTEVPGDITIKMSNHSCNLQFHTTEKNEVSIHTEININGKDEKSVKKIISAVEDFKFDLNGNDLVIDTRFYKNMNSNGLRKTITLNNGDKITIKELNISHELYIPKSAGLKLTNKYSDVNMESLDGEADFILYSSNLNGEDFSQDVSINAKYSKIDAQNFKQNLELELYDTNIAFETCGDAEINSKYSKIEADNTGILKADSYDDKFSVDKMSGLSLVAKYSDLKSEADLTDLHLELYDCNIEINSAKNGTFNGKYSDLVLGDVAKLKIDDSYDNNISLGTTQSIEMGKSKYSKLEIGRTSYLLVDDSYDDEIEIDELGSDFSGLTVNGKYTKLEADAGSVPFQIHFKLKYPNVDIPESVKIIKQIEKSSELELVGNETGGMISVDGYDMGIIIK